MSSHANREERNLTEERQIKAAEAWQAAKASLSRYVGGCLFVAILALCALFYIAGRVQAMVITVEPTHVSTP